MNRTSPTRSTSSRDYQDVPRPVAAMARDLPPDSEIAWHDHPRFQLLYAAQGVMTVNTERETWVVPPQRAVWLPPRTPHRVASSGSVKMRTLYVRPDAAARMAQQCEVFEVTPLLRELILRATELPLEYDEHGAEGRVVALLLDELCMLARLPYNLPIPRSALLVRVCATLRESPGEQLGLEAIAARHGVTTRTLARRFRAETAMSFSEWRRRARLLRALTWIAEGKPILEVALDLGYDSPSAFSAMFKREFGISPTRYRSAAA